MAILRRFVSAVWWAVATACIASYPETVAPRAPSGASDADLQRVIDSVVAATGIPGAVVAVARSGGSSAIFTSGTDNLATHALINPQDRFRVGQITETMVAIVTLQLVDEHALSLDDTLAKWLPAVVPNAGSITVRELLSHTSGIHDYTGDPSFDSAAFADPARQWTESDLIAVANKYPPVFQPGAAGSWALSSTDDILLGMIVERVTGVSIAAQLQTRIFDRLGMTGTWFATTPAAPAPFSRGYNLPGTTTALPMDVTAAVSPTVFGASGAVVFNASDMLVWIQALASGGLLSPASQAALTGSALTVNVAYGYGAGVETFEHWIGNAGDIIGYDTRAFSRPGVGTIVVLTNQNTHAPIASSVLFDAVRWAAFGGQ
jgi:D-alanyl-D-alanine carboxypeptidase